MEPSTDQGITDQAIDHSDTHRSSSLLAADPRGITRRPVSIRRAGRRVHLLNRVREAMAIRDEQRCERALIKLHFEI